MLAVDSDSGKLLWRYDHPVDKDREGNQEDSGVFGPRSEGGVVWVFNVWEGGAGSSFTVALALDPASGKVLGQTSYSALSQAETMGGLLIYPDVFAGTQVFDPRKPAQKWNFLPDRAEAQAVTEAVVVLRDTRGRTHVLARANGKSLWSCTDTCLGAREGNLLFLSGDRLLVREELSGKSSSQGLR